MIKIYSQATHSKITYETKQELKARTLLASSFVARNKKLENDPRVKNGYMSADENFYVKDQDILPTGLLPYAFKILEKAGYKYEHKELRNFPGVDKTYLKRLINDEITFTDINGETRNPKDRPYQKESVLKTVKKRGGIISLPTAAGKCLSADTTLELKVSDELYEELKKLNFLED